MSQRAAHLSAAVVAERLASIRARIAGVGGDPDRVRVVGVTKGHDVDAVVAGIGAGLQHFGENYAAELLDKAHRLGDPAISWHFIGAIQRNKLPALSQVATVYEGVARLVEAEALARRRPGAAVFVEVETTGIASRHGLSPALVPALVDAISALDLDLRGLMTVAPPGGDDAAKAAFDTVASLSARLGLIECSMGMSGDFELAVAAGSTEVRIGTALFGSRVTQVRVSE